MRIGIAGLSRSGKTTVFHLLIGEHASVTKAPGPAIGIAKVTEPRLERLAAIFHPKKVTPVTVECLDFPALTRGGKGTDVEGALLAQLRQVDLILHVIRHFEDARVPHEEGTVDPLKDMALLDTLFLLADLGVVEKRIARITEDVRKGRKDDGREELPLLERCLDWLTKEQNLREMGLTTEEEKSLRGYAPLTLKPLLLLLNIGEEQTGKADPVWEQLQQRATKPRTGCSRLPAKTEWELSQLTAEEAQEFYGALGLESLESPSILGQCLDIGDLITFFTAVGEELRAWAIPQGATALEAAGTVHTDMAKGFIKAEVISTRELEALGSMAAARKQGLLRLEGKGYRVQDGDILTVRFTR
jgi:GTP-binding protein YchF